RHNFRIGSRSSHIPPAAMAPRRSTTATGLQWRRGRRWPARAPRADEDDAARGRPTARSAGSLVPLRTSRTAANARSSAAITAADSYRRFRLLARALSTIPSNSFGRLLLIDEG